MESHASSRKEPLTLETVPMGVVCRGCKYDLRGLDVGRNCPECGAAIEWSVLPIQLVLADRAGMKAIRTSLLVLVVSFLGTLLAGPIGGTLYDLTGLQVLAVAPAIICVLVRLHRLFAITRINMPLSFLLYESPAGFTVRVMAFFELVLHLAASAVAYFTDDSMWLLGLPIGNVLGIVATGQTLRYLGAAAVSTEAEASATLGTFGTPIFAILFIATVFISNYLGGNAVTAILMLVLGAMSLGGFTGLARACAILRAELSAADQIVNTMTNDCDQARVRP
jgi:MFS family permease